MEMENLISHDVDRPISEIAWNFFKYTYSRLLSNDCVMLAEVLRTSTDWIKELHDLPEERKHALIVVGSLLLEWRSSQGSDANFSSLLEMLEHNCGWNTISDNLRKKFLACTDMENLIVGDPNCSIYTIALELCKGYSSEIINRQWIRLANALNTCGELVAALRNDLLLERNHSLIVVGSILLEWRSSLGNGAKLETLLDTLQYPFDWNAISEKLRSRFRRHRKDLVVGDANCSFYTIALEMSKSYPTRILDKEWIKMAVALTTPNELVHEFKNELLLELNHAYIIVGSILLEWSSRQGCPATFENLLDILEHQPEWSQRIQISDNLRNSFREHMQEQAITSSNSASLPPRVSRLLARECSKLTRTRGLEADALFQIKNAVTAMTDILLKWKERDINSEKYDLFMDILKQECKWNLVSDNFSTATKNIMQDNQRILSCFSEGGIRFYFRQTRKCIGWTLLLVFCYTVLFRLWFMATS